MARTKMITSDFLKEIGIDNEELSEFNEAYPQGCDYQEFLDRCCAEGRACWAVQLLHIIGPTDDVRKYDKFVSDDTLDIVFAGKIVFKSGCVVRRVVAGLDIEAGESLEAGKSLEAGLSIKADWDIKAGWGINAGENLEAGWLIKAGDSIQAGGRIKAGLAINAGWGIAAGETIEAGENCGVFAGLRIRINQWVDNARVIAKSKPENLISGYWKEING